MRLISNKFNAFPTRLGLRETALLHNKTLSIAYIYMPTMIFLYDASVLEWCWTRSSTRLKTSCRRLRVCR